MSEEADITVEKKPRAPKAPKAETVAPEVTPELAVEATALVEVAPVEDTPEVTPEVAPEVAPVSVDDDGVTHYSVPVVAAEPVAEAPEVEEDEATEPVEYQRSFVTNGKWRGFTAERRARRKGINL